MYYDNVKDLLNDQKIQDFINNNNFDAVYGEIRYFHPWKLTEVLWDCNIHPEFHMTEIPRCFSPKYITKFDIPDNIKRIDYSAFESCTSLQSIKIPDGVMSIGDHAFYGCDGLKSINIPNGITTIKAGTFNNCTNLKSITITNSVTSIEEGAFYELEELNYLGTKSEFRATGLTRKRLWRNENPLLIKCTDGEINLR